MADQPVITTVRITPLPRALFDPMPTVYAQVEGQDEEIRLFSFYPDEITFTETELLGLTVEQTQQLRHNKDVAYLRS